MPSAQESISPSLQSCNTLAPSVTIPQALSSISAPTDPYNHPSPKCAQTDIRPYLVSTSNTEKDELDAKVAAFVSECDLPVSIVESPFFIAFIDTLRPGYKLPTSQQLSSKLLDGKFLAD